MMDFQVGGVQVFDELLLGGMAGFGR